MSMNRKYPHIDQGAPAVRQSVHPGPAYVFQQPPCGINKGHEKYVRNWKQFVYYFFHMECRNERSLGHDVSCLKSELLARFSLSCQYIFGIAQLVKAKSSVLATLAHASQVLSQLEIVTTSMRILKVSIEILFGFIIKFH